MSAKTYIIILFGIGVLGLAFNQSERLSAWSQKGIKQTIETIALHQMSPGKVEKELSALEQDLPRVKQLLEAADYQPAREVYDRIFGRLDQLNKANSNPPLPRGATLGQEIERHQRSLAAVIENLLDEKAGRLAKGAPENVDLPRLLQRFPRVGNVDMHAAYASRISAIDIHRRVAAVRWIRIQTMGDDSSLGADTLDALATRVKLPPGFTLARGPAVGPLEEAATFATLTVELRPDVRNYVKVQPLVGETETYYDYSTAKGLLIGLNITVKFSTRLRDYPSSWDSAQVRPRDLHFRLDQPKTLEVPAKTEPAEFFLSRNRERIAALSAQLTTAIRDFPALDYSTSSTPPELDRSTALLDTPRFIAALHQARATRTDTTEAWFIVAELALEELAHPLAQRLPAFAPTAQTQIARKLAPHPWLGLRKPLLQLIDTGAPDTVQATVESLKNDLAEDEVRAALLNRLRKERFPASFAKILFTFASLGPSSAAEDCVLLYPELPARLRASLISGLMASHRPRAGELITDRLATATPDELVEIGRAVSASLRQINSARPMHLTDEEHRFFMQAIARLRGEHRKSFISELPPSPILLTALLNSPRADWPADTTLALLEFTQQNLSASHAQKITVLHELCTLLAAGQLTDRRDLSRIDSVLGNISNSCVGLRNHQPSHVPVLIWLLRQPAASPHAETFNRTIVHLLIAIHSPAVLSHPDAKVLLDLGLRHPNDQIRQRITALVPTVEAAPKTN